jgi:hypothetical protein
MRSGSEMTDGLPETSPPSLRRYPANFGEIARGIDEVVLPLGSVAAIQRLARDLVAFGFGMGQSTPYSSESLGWFDKAEDAKKALMENVRALAVAGELAVDPSRSTPNP